MFLTDSRPEVCSKYVLRNGSYKKALYLHLILNELNDLPGLIIDAPYGSNFVTIFDSVSMSVSSFAEKTGHCRELILAVGEAL